MPFSTSPCLHEADKPSSPIAGTRTRLSALDPTRTTLIQRKFGAEIRQRLDLLMGHVWMFLVDEDSLGLVGPTTLAKRQFAFHTDAGKLEAFNTWLEAQIQADILSPAALSGVPLGSIAHGPWTVKYVEKAYRQGLLNAYLSAKKSGMALTAEDVDAFIRKSMRQPNNVSKIELLATRSFEQLKGITGKMSADMNRIMALGIAEGRSPVAIAREMAKSVKGLGKTRAMLIARTEIVHAHAEAQLDMFEELGMENLTIQAEWITAGDDRVCPRCSGNEGKVFTIDKARGLIPLHPNCRCSWTPIEKKTKKRK